MSEEIENGITLTYEVHSRLSEYERLMYPVVSRRSGGLSLGINPNPDKGCNFDCVYCQVDRDEETGRAFDVLQLQHELDEWLVRLEGGEYRGYPLQDLALAGDGEPTTCKELPQVIELLLRYQAKFSVTPLPKLLLFTNGSGLQRTDLLPLWHDFYQNRGEVWFKLDYWDETSLQRINRTRLSYKRLISNLKSFSAERSVVLQSCFFRWDNQVFSTEYYRAYTRQVNELLASGCQVSKIQAYTLARVPADSRAKAWSDDEMDRLGELFRAEIDRPIEVFYERGTAG